MDSDNKIGISRLRMLGMTDWALGEEDSAEENSAESTPVNGGNGRGRRHWFPAKRWEVVRSEDRELVGTYLEEKVAFRLVRQGFYADDTLIRLPHLGKYALVYHGKAYLLTDDGDIATNPDGTDAVYSLT